MGETPPWLHALPCRLCGEPTRATTLLYLSQGCVCAPDHLQALCAQHTISAEPLGGKGILLGFDPWNEGRSLHKAQEVPDAGS